MSNLREAAQQALEALENEHNSPRGYGYELSMYEARETSAAITALRAALAQQEPTVRIKCTVVDNQHPSGIPFEQWVNAPRREWQSLSEEEIKTAVEASADFWATSRGWITSVARAIEQALKEKNNG